MTPLQTHPSPAPARRPPRWDQIQDQRRPGAHRAVGVVGAIVNVLCGASATVLVAHIVMFMGGMNPANGIASYVRHWAAEVSLGLNDLLTPASATLRVVLNDGLAAIVWLSFGVLVTILVRRLASPRSGRIG